MFLKNVRGESMEKKITEDFFLSCLSLLGNHSKFIGVYQNGNSTGKKLKSHWRK